VCYSSNAYLLRLIEIWKGEECTWNERNLNQLRFYEEVRKNPRGELEALFKIFELKTENASDWDYCLLLSDIAEKQVELEEIQEAFDTVLKMLPRLKNICDWKNFGLGRSFIGTCMDIIISGSSDNAIQLWNYMKPYVVKMEYIDYEKVATAADKMGDEDLSKLFLKRLAIWKESLPFL